MRKEIRGQGSLKAFIFRARMRIAHPGCSPGSNLLSLVWLRWCRGKINEKRKASWTAAPQTPFANTNSQHASTTRLASHLTPRGQSAVPDAPTHPLEVYRGRLPHRHAIPGHRVVQDLGREDAAEKRFRRELGRYFYFFIMLFIFKPCTDLTRFPTTPLRFHRKSYTTDQRLTRSSAVARKALRRTVGVFAVLSATHVRALLRRVN